MYSTISKYFDSINNHVIKSYISICGHLSKHKYYENIHIMKKCMIIYDTTSQTSENI